MKILNIAWYDLKKLFREKTALFFLILLPVIFIFVMGSVYGSASSSDAAKIPVGIVNNDGSKISLDLINEISKDKTIYIKDIKDEDLSEMVRNVEVEIGFIIPKDFGKKVEEGKEPEIEVLKLPKSADFLALEGIVNSAYTKIHVNDSITAFFGDKLKAANVENTELILTDISGKFEENLKTPLITVQASAYTKDGKTNGFDGKAMSSLGMMVMFVMFTVILGAGEILDEKKSNTWGRLNITPTNKMTIVFGKFTGTFLKGWVQVIILILFSNFIMGVNWGNSILATIILMSIYLISVTGLGMFLSSLVKTNSQLGAVSAITIICTSMLSGCYWPIEMMPAAMQNIAALFPQYWAMKGLTNTVVGGLGIEYIVTPALVLLAIGAVFFTLSVLSGNFKVSFNKMEKPIEN